MTNKLVEFKLTLPFDLIITTYPPLDLKEWDKMLKLNPKKTNEYRAYPYLYFDLLTKFQNKGYTVKTNILTNSHLSHQYYDRFNLKLKLRDYQRRALKQFIANKGRGVVILPTAAGKTIIGLHAIKQLQRKTLIVVPVINLLEQWIDRIVRYTDLSSDMIGQVGDNVKEIKEITVSTYASVRQNINILRKEFGFIIFDEVHHLPAEKTVKIAEGFPAYYRLGLTATPERADRGEEKLIPLIGPKIIVTNVTDLADKGYIANYELNTVEVELTPEEQAKYLEYMNTYKNYLKKRRISIRSPQDFERKIIFRVNIDPEARAALNAHRKARALVFSSESKINAVEELLLRHKKDQVLIFSEFNDMVYKISKEFLIPSITYETKSSERNRILNKFGTGEYTKLVTGKVLDEGFDVKEANVGIIVSGTGQSRQFIQRLGRLLRPKNKLVKLYELVTPGTLEVRTAKRRKESDII